MPGARGSDAKASAKDVVPSRSGGHASFRRNLKGKGPTIYFSDVTKDRARIAALGQSGNAHAKSFSAWCGRGSRGSRFSLFR